MIGYLRGKAEVIGNDYALIECNQVGYKVYMNTNDLAFLSSATDEILVYTSMYLREDIIALYGFLNQDDLTLFELLITVSGVGPKAAINIFSVLSGNDIKFAILSDDVNSICKAPGIGKKTAQKLILELKDKFSLETVFDERSQMTESISSTYSDEYTIALEGLVALGYTAMEAKSALKKCNTSDANAEKLIKDALKYLF